LILDTSVLIADERGKFDMPGFLRQFPTPQPLIAAITASELLHGVERAQDASRKAWRQQQVEQILASITVQPFDLAQARCHPQRCGVSACRWPACGGRNALPSSVTPSTARSPPNPQEMWCNQGVHPTGATCPFGKPFVFRVFGVFRGLNCRSWDDRFKAARRRGRRRRGRPTRPCLQTCARPIPRPLRPPAQSAPASRPEVRRPRQP
jgi:tRNA(fMet)-specific endonuclease VapC